MGKRPTKYFSLSLLVAPKSDVGGPNEEIGDGNFYLYLHGDVRKPSRTKIGDRVQVEVSFDEVSNGPMPV